MATPNLRKTGTPGAPAPAPAAAPVPPRTTTVRGRKPTPDFLFDKSNYRMMLIGLALIVLGFVLMAGGKSEDPNVFNYDDIYSFRRITLAPILILIGFAVEGYAIMKKPKEDTTATPPSNV